MKSETEYVLEAGPLLSKTDYLVFARFSSGSVGLCEFKDFRRERLTAYGELDAYLENRWKLNSIQVWEHWIGNSLDGIGNFPIIGVSSR